MELHICIVVNGKVTIYHLSSKVKNVETWTRYNYDEVFIIGGKGASTNKGYDKANDISVRLWYKDISDLNISNFAIGDIMVPSHIEKDITMQSELKDYLTYNITAIQDNITGSDDVKHIHISGK